MKTLIKILAGAFIIFLLISFSGIFYLKRGLDEGKNLKINSIKLASIKDGKYTGEYEKGRWKNKLSITIKNNEIT
ncbi:MAG: hypothetical protein ACQERZ_03100, partial [Fusobacteriota bacterium]